VIALRQEFPVQKLCSLLAVPRSMVYYKPSAGAHFEMQPLKDMIRALRVTFPGCGARKMYYTLLRQSAFYTREQVRMAYAELGILGKARARKPRTTDSTNTKHRFKNLVKDLKLDRPNQVWVGDVTYIHVNSRFAYLALLMDAYSRFIVGWALSLSNDTSLVQEALTIALQSGCPEIHHSDQGTPYGSTAYTKILAAHGIRSSMSLKGKPEDNGKAERLNRTVKEEETYRSDYLSLSEAHEGITHYVLKYNTMRLHQAIQYKTPAELYHHTEPTL